MDKKKIPDEIKEEIKEEVEDRKLDDVSGGANPFEGVSRVKSSDYDSIIKDKI